MRTKKALFNIVSQFSYEIVAMICGLILPRIILANFGSSYNGMISSITQFLDYISILTLGIAGATRVAIYNASAENDIRKTSAVIKATEKYMRKVALAFIAYMIILAFVYPYIVRNEFKWFESASLVVIIGLGVFAEYFFGITYSTFLAAKQCSYIYNIIQIISKIANTLITIFLIYIGCTIQIVKLGSAICFVLSPLLLNIVVRKKFKIDSTVEADTNALSQRKNVMAHSIANCIHQYTDIFLLTIFTSTSVVSIYSVYNLILGSLRKLQNVFTSGLEGAFGELWAKKEYNKFEDNFNTLEFLIFSFVSVFFSCAMILIIPFIKIYTKNITDANYVLPFYAFIAVITYAVYSLRTPYLTAVQAAGKYKETKNGAIIEAVLNFSISLIAVLKFGMYGVIFGTLVANAFRTIQYIIFISKKLLNRSIFIPIKRFIFTLITFSINVLLYYWIFSNLFVIEKWSQWVSAGVVCFITGIVTTLVFARIFYKDDLKKSFCLVEKMLSKGKRC